MQAWRTPTPNSAYRRQPPLLRASSCVLTHTMRTPHTRARARRRRYLASLLVSLRAWCSPWIVSAHRFASEDGHGSQADIARLKIDGDPGEYVVHWYWRGYSDCHDVAVMPNDAAAGTVVPLASRYGSLGAEVVFARIDHAQFGGGLVLQSMEWRGFNQRSDALAPNTCSSKPPAAYNAASGVRTCIVIPPEGKTNYMNETHGQALKACQNRCLRLGNSCVGVNAVPLELPSNVQFQTQAIPFNNGNCAAKCFNKEPTAQRAESFVCYPVQMAGNRFIEEDWSVAPDDTQNEVSRYVPPASAVSLSCNVFAAAAGTHRLPSPHNPRTTDMVLDRLQKGPEARIFGFYNVHGLYFGDVPDWNVRPHSANVVASRRSLHQLR